MTSIQSGPSYHWTHEKAERWNALKRESTLMLIRRIVEHSDEMALHVFHETRTLFYRNGKWVRLVEFLRALRDSSAGYNPGSINISEVSDDSYDLTLAKFRNIPSPSVATQSSLEDDRSKDQFTWNVDCRHHFKSLMNKIEAELSRKALTSENDVESAVSKITTKFVGRHFYLSLKECRRRKTTSIRYAWAVQGRVLYLYYPAYLTAAQFLNWLEDNMKDVDLDALNEKDRIQAIIDEKYPCGANIRADDPEILEEAKREDKPWLDQKHPGGTDIQADDPETADNLGMEDKPPIEYNEGNEFSDRLGIHVAKEKSENLDDLRPAIRSLGKERVYNLVKRIFTDMADEQYNLSEVARKFNLSKATLSRFAGSDWRKDEDIKQLSKADIPDLWINTARVLAKNTTLMETVKSTGFVGAIDDILTIVGPQKGPNDE